MRKVIFTLAFLISLFISTSSFSTEKVLNLISCTAQCQFTEWVEYVLIDGQWYKITHLADGTIIIQACGSSGND